MDTLTKSAKQLLVASVVSAGYWGYVFGFSFKMYILYVVTTEMPTEGPRAKPEMVRSTLDVVKQSGLFRHCGYADARLPDPRLAQLLK